MAVVTAGGEEGISHVERNFLLAALTQHQRLDGRSDTDYRDVNMSFTRFPNKATADVSLGQSTRAYAVVTCEVVPPYPDRPMEGFLRFNVELSSMASPSFTGGKPSGESIEISRIVERVIKDSRAIDTEALCIVSGEKVWSLRCDIHILDHGGNLIDVACLSAMAALMHFRRPDISVQGDRVKIHSYEERAPVPLSIHHIPVCVTYGIFSSRAIQEAANRQGDAIAKDMSEDVLQMLESEDDFLVIDPSYREEYAMEGRITFALNAHGELCGVHKLGGAALTRDKTIRTAKHASTVATNLINTLNTTLEKADQHEKERDRIRHALAAGYRSDGNRLTSQLDAPKTSESSQAIGDNDASEFLQNSHIALSQNRRSLAPSSRQQSSSHGMNNYIEDDAAEKDRDNPDETLGSSEEDDDMLNNEFDM